MEADMGFLTIKEVANVLRVTPATARRLANDGIIPSYRVGLQEQIRIKAEDLKNYIVSVRSENVRPVAGTHDAA
jgi:excisionase family DNA binding protein